VTDNETPKGWAQTTLGTVTKHRSGNGQLIKGKIFQEPGPGRIPAYSASGQDVWCDQADYDGDGVIVSAVGARCGKSFRASGKWTAIANTHVVQPVAGAVDPVLLWYLLNDESFWVKSGTAQPFVAVRKTFERVFLMPPRPEQDRIVSALDERLSELDASVASLERAERNLVRYRAAVLAAACSGKLVPTEADLARRAGRSYEPADQLLARILAERRKANTKAKYEEPAQPDISKLPKLPEGWAWASVEQLGNGARSSAYGVLQPGDDVPNGVPFVRVGDINDGRVDGTGLKRITQAISTQYPRTLLRGQEVLITLVGTIGRTAVVPESLKDANVARAVGVLPMGKFVDPSWVELWLRQPWSKHRLVGAAHEVARKTLNLEDVRLFPVGLPPVAEQSRILEEVDRHLSRADALAASIAQSKRRAQRLRRAILAAAFQGRLVPQDPNDEPASVLLDRIRAQAAIAEAATAAAPRRSRPPAQPAASVASASPLAMTPKRRGRPPGSKNKAKA
jgi:type I restriction enzyme, S subunit